jgi:membrane associated rhomboid family serine protease
MIRGLGNLNNLNGNGGQEGSFKDKIKAYWQSIPIIVKSIITLTLFFYLMSWFKSFSGFLAFLQNIPIFTLKKFRIWTLMTSILITPSVINILFAFMSWIPGAINLENELGSVRFFLNTVSRSVLIQSLYVVVMGILALLFFGVEFMEKPSMGLWPLIMADITISCTESPDREVMFFFIPYPIQSKYYPWVLIGFFTLLNFNLQFDLLCGILFGYLYTYKLKDLVNFSNQFVSKVENSLLCKYVRDQPSFVPSNASNTAFGFSGQVNVNQNVSTANNTTNNTRSNDESNYAVSSYLQILFLIIVFSRKILLKNPLLRFKHSKGRVLF